ncbi:MAG: polyphenol oxidase family protein [Microgenomates group bacterium]
MVHKTDHGLYQSSIISRIPGVIHGFTAKIHGSMLESENQQKFFLTLGINPESVISAHQTHGVDIRVVTPEDAGKRFEGVDGFVYKKSDTSVTHPVLVVHVGDCVPIMLIDPIAKIIGVAHAGWKGTKDHIMRNVLQEFVRNGSDPVHIHVVIGPYIHACCYKVDEDRAMVFEREFPGGRGIVNRSGVSWFIDLGIANIMDLKRGGVLEKNIEMNDQLCTYDTPLEFFSYRRTTEPFGEILGFIGYK